MKFHEDLSGGSHAGSCGGRTDRRNCFANAPKKGGICRINRRRREERQNKGEEKNAREEEYKRRG